MDMTITRERWYELIQKAVVFDMINDAVTNKHSDGTVKTYQEIVEEVKFLLELGHGKN